MREISTEEDLIELLFEELDQSEPQWEADPSFLLRIGGLCHGMIYGGCEGAPPYLSDTLAILWRDNEPSHCGKKLVRFAGLLQEEGCFDPTRAWSIPRLIELMLEALKSDNSRIQNDSKTKRRYVVSTPEFAKRRGVSVQVQLGEA